MHRISAGSKPAKHSVLETEVCVFESRPADDPDSFEQSESGVMPLWRKRRTHLHRKQDTAGSYPAGGTVSEGDTSPALTGFLVSMVKHPAVNRKLQVRVLQGPLKERRYRK